MSASRCAPGSASLCKPASPHYCRSTWNGLLRYLEQLLLLSPASFAERFGGSAVERAGRDQLVRNACLAAANAGQTRCCPLLEQLLNDASPIVRGHAAWALARLAGPAAAPLLRDCLARETDPGARLDLSETLSTQ